MKKFLIIHYNTPTLTECLVKSINKFTPDCHIYIFDNSDKKPYNYKIQNVTIFDNTKQQIIPFEQILSKYPNRGKSLGKRSNYGSFRHCISVDKCFDLIDDNFVLLDSDILLKRDISELFDERYGYIGEIENWSWGKSASFPKVDRLIPFISFINVKKAKEKNIRYYNDRYMDGLYNPDLMADSYDTGAYFLKMMRDNNVEGKTIKYSDYIVHFHGGSYTNMGRDEHISPDMWLKKYKRYYTIKNKKIVYTCVTGSYDGFFEPKVLTDDFDYVYFTDSHEKYKNVNSIWEFRPLPKECEGLSNAKKNRYLKINPHKLFPDYELSIYVDGSMEISGDLNKFLESKCGEHKIYIPQHPVRKCLYEEAKVCVRARKDTMENIEPQIKQFKKEGFPSNFGLTQNNIIVRRHNSEDVKKLMETWWDIVKKGSHRDQLSFGYALWKTKFTDIGYLEKRICHSEYFEWDSFHRKRSNPIQNTQQPIVTKQQKRIIRPSKRPVAKKIISAYSNNALKTFLGY